VEIGVFGATGIIGQRVVTEALARGHRLRAFTREAVRIPAEPGQVRWQVANVLRRDEVTAVIGGLDILINAINAGGDIPETIAQAAVLPEAAHSLLSALEDHPAIRLIVVGGAGSLEVQPGLQVVDMPGFAEQLPKQLGVPQEYSKVVLAHREALHAYRLSNRNWTYLSPSAGLVQPGARTGRFRVGGNQLLVGEDGAPAISAEDLAVAILDEAEVPQHLQRRYTVGY